MRGHLVILNSAPRREPYYRNDNGKVPASTFLTWSRI